MTGRLVAFLFVFVVAVAAASEPPPRVGVILQTPDTGKSDGRWKSLLAKQVESADRIVIEDINVLFGKETKPLHTIVGVAKVRELLARVSIAEDQSGGHCMCVGDAVIAFMKGPRCLAQISFHHSQRLRWHDGPWKGDAELTNEAKAQVPLWFMQEGFPAFEEERQRQIKDATERKAEFETFLSFFPTAKQQGSFRMTVPVSSLPSFQTATVRASRPEVLRCVESCFALGVLIDRNWFMSETLREFAIANCREASGGAFLEAVQLVRDEPIALVGAARLFFREGFREKVARADRIRCSLLLGDAELQQPYPGNKDYVIRVLGGFRSPETADYLRLVAHGEKGSEIEPRLRGQDPGIRGAAYLALAMQADRAIAPELRGLVANRDSSPQVDAAYRIALTLVSSESLLRADDFKFESYSIGYAALKVIETRPTVDNIDLLVSAGIKHPWGAIREDAIGLFQKLTGVDWLVANEYGRREGYGVDEKIRKWWAKNRASYKGPGRVQKSGSL